MKLATIRQGDRTAAVRIDENSNQAIELGETDLQFVLDAPNWRERVAAVTGTSSPAHPLDGLDYAPLIGQPNKIVCVGLNYREHILEMGRGLPDYPTLFNKFSGALIGANDPIRLPAATCELDWEAELGIVIGAATRDADDARARAAIAGWTVLNDVTARDWQYRTTQWMQGKTFEGSTPVGPSLLVSDDGLEIAAEIECLVNGEVMQRANTEDLLFGPTMLISYISEFITLLPGDIIATGTPAGVGHGRKPPVYLSAGDVVTARIAGIGECVNQVASD